MKRRGFVVLGGAALTAPAHQWLVHEPEPLVSGLSGRRVSTGLVDHFRAMISELRKMEDMVGGGNVRYTLALMANDTARQGWRPADAVTLIETALAGTRRAQTPALLAQLHVRHAHAAAFLGDTSTCTKAISQARTQVEHLTPEDEPPWLYWVSPAQIISMSGACLLQLGQSDHAVAMLTEGLAHLEEPFVRDRQGYVTALARAFARPGKQRDLDVATGLGMEAVDLTEGLDSTIALGYLRDLYHELKPHGKASAVRDFLDRAQGLAAV